MCTRYSRDWRRNQVMAPLTNSISEHRDMQHDATMLNQLRRELATFDADLIWERSCRLHCAGLVIALELGIPYVLEWKDHLVDYRFSWYRRRAIAMENRKNSEADNVVVESAYLREYLVRSGVPREKVLVAHNAADPRQFHCNQRQRTEIRKVLGVGEDEILAGYLGSYAFYHDARRLVLAADILKQQQRPRIKILMVGDGLEYNASRALAERLGVLEADILMMRPKVAANEVAAILSALDIAVLPGSTKIICPIKVQEYMAAGLPTVLPEYPANREVITQGQTGTFFTPADAQSLADCLVYLARDATLRDRLGKQARETVGKHFTWERTWGAALEMIVETTAFDRHRR